MKKKTVCILGGGIAGLSASWRLAEAGFDVHVFEREKKVGGLSKTVEHKGFLFDYSAHRFNSDNPHIVNKFKYLIGKDYLIKPKKLSLIYHWGKHITYPPRAMELIQAMPLPLLVRACFEFTYATIKSFFITPSGKSFPDWTRSRFGKTLSMHLNEKYAEKLWKLPAKKLSGDWASARIGAFKLKDFLLASLFRFRYKQVYSQSHPDSDWFYYSKKGIGRFPERLAEETVKHGGHVTTEAIVNKIEKTAQGYTIGYIHKGTMHTQQCDYVISTIPLDILVRSLRPAPPQAILKAINSLNYLAVILVNVLVDKKKLTNASWIYYPENDIIFNYIMEFKHWSKHMAPKDQTALNINITCKIGDSTWKMTDEALIKRCTKDLEKIGIVNKEDIFDGFVDRLPYAYPVYDLNYKPKVTKIKKYLDSLPNFIITGRTGSFQYINSDKAMEWALDEAEKIIDTHNK